MIAILEYQFVALIPNMPSIAKVVAFHAVEIFEETLCRCHCCRSGCKDEGRCRRLCREQKCSQIWSVNGPNRKRWMEVFGESWHKEQ